MDCFCILLGLVGHGGGPYDLISCELCSCVVALLLLNYFSSAGASFAYQHMPCLNRPWSPPSCGVLLFSKRENPYTYQHGSSLSLSVSMMHVCMVGGWKSSINLILYIYTRSPSTCRQRKLSSSSPMDPNNNILY